MGAAIRSLPAGFRAAAYFFFFSESQAFGRPWAFRIRSRLSGARLQISSSVSGRLIDSGIAAGIDGVTPGEAPGITGAPAFDMASLTAAAVAAFGVTVAVGLACPLLAELFEVGG